MNNKINGKVGLVTLYKNNYGSVLQCYSLKKVIEELGFECKILSQSVEKTNRYTVMVNKACKVLIKSIRYPGYFSSSIKMKNAMAVEKSFITSESLEKLNIFIAQKLMPMEYTWEQLCELGNAESYSAFFVGSDQVWNASRPVKPFYFLKFVPFEKKHTYAVSFGVSAIPHWNIKNQRDGINGFRHISVREETGYKLVNNCCCEISREVDPTILLNKYYWKEFCSDISISYENYVFIHFLNTPNQVAINAINRVLSKSEYSAVCFAYQYPEYENIDCFINVDGGPKEYVALIANAKYIFTDSFHTTLFSLNLKKDFFVFHRRYLHDQPQTSRISDLLARLGLESRLILDENELDIEPIYYESDDIFKKERESSLNYLKSELGLNG